MKIKYVKGQGLDLALGIINIVVGIVFWNPFSIANFLVGGWCLSGVFVIENS